MRAAIGHPAAALSLGGMSIQPSPAPAFDQDAPDPDVVVSGSTYYAFTTGTPLGNHLQALVDTSGSPASGWRSYTGQSFGSSALPVVPSWEQVDTQTSPGVFHWGGHWLMYYDASQAGTPPAPGGTASRWPPPPPSPRPIRSSPTHSTQPLLCQPGWGDRSIRARSSTR